MVKTQTFPRGSSVIGIDIGATKIEWILIENNKIGGSKIVQTPTDANNEDLLASVESIIYGTDAKIAGICVAGFVNQNKIIKMPNVPKVENLDFSKALGKNVFVQNDLKCAALAIWFKRGKKENDSFTVVSPGSGIGGAIVHQGRLVCGQYNLAGEFGHMKFPFERIRGDPQLLDWESLCGGKGVEEQFRAIVRGSPSLGKKYELTTAKEIFESESPLAKRVCSQAAFYFGVGLANIANALAPQEIILAGSVSKAYMGKYRLAMHKAFESAVIEPHRNIKISHSEFENPALMGSILLTRQRTNKKIERFLGI